MSNPFTNWLHSRKFSAALKQNNIQLAQELLENKQRLGVKLSLLEKVFRDKLQLEQNSKEYENEVVALRKQISQNLQNTQELTNKNQQFEEFIKEVYKQLKYKEQEVVSIQQQLEVRKQENQALYDQIKYKEQEVISIQQQLQARKQETDLLQQQLAAHGQKIEALRNQQKHKQQEFIFIQQQLNTREHERQASLNQLNQTSDVLVNNLILPLQKFDESVKHKFKFNEINDKLLQSTGIDQEIFYELEENLVKYLQVEFERYTPQESLKTHLKETHCKDISTSLQRGQDPEYNSYLTPHIYFMEYFLEGVYSAYLAWFLVYRSQLLRTKVNILDIGAGSGAIIYGLFSLLKSASNFIQLPETHISYCSLEQQNLLQHHGLEFWKLYIEQQNISTINTYYRFKTIDLFTYGSNDKELPNKFFDFVVISHCIFANKEQRIKSHKVYRKIFSDSLKENGHVLIIVQGRRLFQAYSRNQTEDQAQEEKLVRDFIEELGLKLEWYKYMTSTGKRIPLRGEFGRFARNNLSVQPHINPLRRKYLDPPYDLHYVLDDYAILAKKA